MLVNKLTIYVKSGIFSPKKLQKLLQATLVELAAFYASAPVSLGQVSCLHQKPPQCQYYQYLDHYDHRRPAGAPESVWANDSRLKV